MLAVILLYIKLIGGVIMKKLLVMYLLMFVFVLNGCQVQASPDKFTEQFIKTYYTISDYTKIKGSLNVENFIKLYINDYSKPIQQLMTEQAFKEDYANRMYYSLLASAVNSKFNLQEDNIKIKKANESKDNPLVYNYTCDLKLLFADRTETLNIGGQVTINKVDNDWKISHHYQNDPNLSMIFNKYYFNTQE